MNEKLKKFVKKNTDIAVIIGGTAALIALGIWYDRAQTEVTDVKVLPIEGVDTLCLILNNRKIYPLINEDEV